MTNADADAPFAWTATRERAACLVAADDQSDERIAASLGIVRATLSNWKRHPDFAARVEQIVAEYRAAVLQRGIAVRENRMAALDDRWRRLRSVVEAWAAALQGDADPFKLGAHRDAALASGFESGMVGIEWVTTPKGNFRPQFKTDTALSAEMRNLEKQAAQEMGEWVERGSQAMEVSGKGGKPLTVRVVYQDEDADGNSSESDGDT